MKLFNARLDVNFFRLEQLCCYFFFYRAQSRPVGKTVFYVATVCFLRPFCIRLAVM